MNPCILMFGGRSDERLVSVASAQNLTQQFDFAKRWFVTVDGRVHEVSKDELGQHKDPFKTPFQPTSKPIADSIENAISSLKKETVFMGFHGTEGEDGQIQAMLEKRKIAFTGSGSEASHNCFRKPLAKQIVARVGISLAPELLLSGIDFEKTETELRAFFAKHAKIVVKPIANGSSIGLHIIHDEAALGRALKDIRASKGEDFMAEKFIIGREITVGVIEHKGKLQALPASEVLLNAGHNFDYDGKYLGRGTTEITPADLNQNELARVQKIAVDAHQALKCFGYTRTDVVLTADGAIFLETNTLPGMTKASFIPQQLHAAGIPLKEFLAGQIELAERRNAGL